MSDYSTIEMGSVDRPPNRFQVNPVSHKSNKDKGNNTNSANTTASEAGNTTTTSNEDNVPHEVYRRLTGSDGEPLEDDTFNEDAAQMLKAQQQPRQQR